MEGPELGLRDLFSDAGLHVVKHHRPAAVNKCQFLTFLVRVQTLCVVLGCEHRSFAGASVSGDLVEVCPTLLCSCVIDGFVVLAPNHLVHPLVRRGRKFLKELAFSVGQVQPSPNDKGELLAVW